MNWIPVTERLPENERIVLLAWEDYLGKRSPITGYYADDINDGEWMADNDTMLQPDTVSHWMPLPELPTVDATMPVDPALVPDVANDTTRLQQLGNSLPMPKDAHEQLLTAINEHFTLDGMKIGSGNPLGTRFPTYKK